MKKIQSNIYEIDVLDIILLIFGGVSVIGGLITQSILFPIGIALLFLTLWGNLPLKLISILLSITIIVFLKFTYDIFDSFAPFLIGFGYDIAIVNYLALWPIIIAATISIFSIFYSWGEKKVLLTISSIIFLIFSSLIAYINARILIQDTAGSIIFLFWTINFAVYLFSYIFSFSIYYICVKIMKFSILQINSKLFKPDIDEKVPSSSSSSYDDVNQGETGKSKGKSQNIFNIQQVNHANKAGVQILALKKESQPISKWHKPKTILFFLIGLILTVYFSIQFINYNANTNVYDYKYEVYATPIYLSFIGFAFIILAVFLTLKPNLKFVSIGLSLILGMVFNAFIVSIYINFRVFMIFDEGDFGRVLADIILIFFSGINCLNILTNVILNFKDDFEKPPKKPFNPLVDIIFPLTIGGILFGFFLLGLYYINGLISMISDEEEVINIDFYFVLQNLIDYSSNTQEFTTEKLLALIALLVMLMFFEIVIFSLTKALLSTLNQQFHYRQYFAPIKLSLDLILSGFYLIFIVNLILFNDITLLRVISIIFIISGFISYILILNQVSRDKVDLIKKGHKLNISYANFKEIEKELAHKKKFHLRNKENKIRQIQSEKREESELDFKGEKAQNISYLF